jgi:hypothetical protein
MARELEKQQKVLEQDASQNVGLENATHEVSINSVLSHLTRG